MKWRNTEYYYQNLKTMYDEDSGRREYNHFQKNYQQLCKSYYRSRTNKNFGCLKIEFGQHFESFVHLRL